MLTLLPSSFQVLASSVVWEVEQQRGRFSVYQATVGFLATFSMYAAAGGWGAVEFSGHVSYVWGEGHSGILGHGLFPYITDWPVVPCMWPSIPEVSL